MGKKKKNWKGIEERELTPQFHKSLESEFPEDGIPDLFKEESEVLKSDLSRRSFLKASGFSLTSVLLASCIERKVEKAIPYIIKPEAIIPGRSYWYSTTCGACEAQCGILTKNRDGRPIKIEGNPDHPLSKGGLCAVGQASLLGLYDSKRITEPQKEGSSSDWATVDNEINKKLDAITEGVYFLTSTITSPTTRNLISGVVDKYQNSGHVEYDAVSHSSILDSHEKVFGNRVLPHYRFDRAKTIISFDADFLGTWVSPVEFTKDYISGRNAEGNPEDYSYHVQFESRLSLTGSNSDKRIISTKAEMGAYINLLAEKLSHKAGLSFGNIQDKINIDENLVDNFAERMWSQKGESLVVCGINSIEYQNVVNYINELLGNYGSTLDIINPSYQTKGNDNALADLISKLNEGKVNALFISGCNPLYSLTGRSDFMASINKVPLKVYISDQNDETAEVVNYILPTLHFLESWGDTEPISGLVSLYQPTINPIGNGRSFNESISALLGNKIPNDTLIKTYWEENIYSLAEGKTSFTHFWSQTLNDGYAVIKKSEIKNNNFDFNAVKAANVKKSTALGIILYQKISMLNGKHSYNPWLQELPDPISKITWGNYASIAPKKAEELGIAEGDEIILTVDDVQLKLPAQIQVGQHNDIVAIALGYGTKSSKRFSDIGPKWLQSEPTIIKGDTVGSNSFVFTSMSNGNITYSRDNVSIVKSGAKMKLAVTQTHHTITVPENLGGQVRDHAREILLKDVSTYHATSIHNQNKQKELWEDDFQYTGHHWGLAIDLNKCTGCSSCVVGCQVENNIPVVGMDEVYRRREMHWMRIDRYYSGDDENVDVIYQPMMCQHCDHASCEVVCPVLATVHSSEGLNQQVYNRCVGTRYCANNCAFKVRRFNWFDYAHDDQLANMTLNPDVTIRTRGIMEKCSLCIHRIHEAKTEAKRKNVSLADGDIVPACMQSCSADAIVFGDLNDPNSRINSLTKNNRHYHLLEEMNFRPTTGYLAKVRNKTGEESHNG